MPRLLPDNPKKRESPYAHPHSPWQRMVDAARLDKGLSHRDLAKRIGANQGSIWIWLHNLKGYPSQRSCTPARLKLLSETLGLLLEKLQQALDESRRVYTRADCSDPLPSRDALQDFIQVLENDRRGMIPRGWVINLAKRFLASAKLSPPNPTV